MGRAPTADAHRAFLNAIVRYGPRAGLMGAAQTRLSELWAAAGCQLSVFASAQPPERPTEPLRLSVIGRALLGGQGGVVGRPAKRPGEAGSHPFGPSLLGLDEGEGVEEGTMRRRVCISREVPRPAGQGPFEVCAAASVGSLVAAQGLMRSSALGRALLRAQGDRTSAIEHGPGVEAGHPGAFSRVTAAVSDVSEQRSLLGEAAGAEDRLVLKRRRLVGNPGLEQPCSQGALDALAACRRVEVASAVAAWPSGSRDQVGRGGSSSSGPSGPC